MRLLITRPREDGEPLAQALEARGHAVTINPLLEIVWKSDVAVPLEGVQALLATSANGVRAFVRLSPRRELPLLAVGSATAHTAHEAGFAKVISAEGDVRALAALAARVLDKGRGPLLHIAGDVQTGDLKSLMELAGFALHRTVLYEARAAKAFGPSAYRMLATRALDGVLFFSPRSVRIFLALAAETGLTASLTHLMAFCLSPAVAEAVGAAAWRQTVTAPRPDQDALLACVDQSEGRGP